MFKIKDCFDWPSLFFQIPQYALVRGDRLAERSHRFEINQTVINKFLLEA